MIVVIIGAIATVLLAPFLPMILLVGMVLGVLSAFVEIKLVNHVAPIRWINSKSSIAGFALSIGISMVLGAIFGLSGLIAGIAGLGSSALTEPYFAVRRNRKKNSALDAKFNEIRDAWMPVLKAMRIFVIILMVLVMMPVHIRRLWLRLSGQASTA